MNKYTVSYLKSVGKNKAMSIKDSLEDENCNLDYDDAKEGIIYSKNCDIINLIEQIYTFGEL